MSETGRLLNVEEHVVGSAATSVALIGGSDIFPIDVDEFDPAGGRLRHIGAGDVQTVYTYDSIEDGVIHLTTPLTVAVAEGDAIRVEPLTIVRDAEVALEDGTGESISATIPHSLIGRIEAGVRDFEGEAVRVREVEPGEWVLTDVLAKGKGSAGFRDLEWFNDAGIPLIGGDEAADVGYALFGVGMESAEFKLSNKGPVLTDLPSGASGTIRKVGSGGVGSGALKLGFPFPVKVTAEALASLELDETSPTNVRFYIVCVETETDAESYGDQGVQRLPASGFTDGLQTQVSAHRQFTIEENADGSVRPFNLWWGFASTAGGAQDVRIRHMSMIVRVAYAPGVPTGESPGRRPAWTSDADTEEAYVNAEEDDLDPI